MLLWGPIYGLSFGLVTGLVLGLVGYLLILLIYVLPDKSMGEFLLGLRVLLILGVFLGLVSGLLGGLVAGLIDGLSGQYKEIRINEGPNSLSWQRVKSSLYSALFWMLFGQLTMAPINAFVLGLKAGMVTTVKYDGLVLGVVGAAIGGFREICLANPLKLSWIRFKNGLLSGMFFGLIFGTGMSIGLTFDIITVLNLILAAKLDFLGFSKPINRFIFGLLFGVIGGLGAGLIFKPTVNLEVPNPLLTQKPNHYIKLSTKYSFIIGLGIGIGFGVSIGLIDERFKGVVFGVIAGVIGGAIGGGDVVTKHIILRLILFGKKLVPLNYARFLDYCHDRIFLRKVGGGYIFIHRMLLEHFANMTEDDIKRLAADIEASRS